jgi:hypothetical protein
LEREFYGYPVVIQEQGEADGADPAASPYQKAVLTFRTDSYYTKGLTSEEELYDAAGRLFTRSANTYRLYDVDAQGIGSADAETARIFPQLERTETFFHEGLDNQIPGKSSLTTFEYDLYGNVKRFVDAGEVGEADDAVAVIDYAYRDDESWIVDRPATITVTGGDGKTYRVRKGQYDAKGNLRAHTGFDGAGQESVTTLDYHPNGTLKTVTGPANAKGERYALNYRYDAPNQQYVTRTEDSFGYVSEAGYDYRFGQPLWTLDLNKNRIEYLHDTFGRTAKVWGPYDIGARVATFDFEYHPEAGVPWALTRNKGFWQEDDTLDTLLYIDGLKRVVQTKKEAELLQGDVKVYGLTVSGKVEFDALGRTVAQGQPLFESGYQTPFVWQMTPKNPTLFTYDLLGRTTLAVLPDQAKMQTAYGFEEGLFLTRVIDPKLKEKKTLKDVRGNIAAVKELLAGTWITTRYAYDPLSQIVTVLDDHRNRTTVAYDQLQGSEGVRSTHLTKSTSLVV